MTGAANRLDASMDAVVPHTPLHSSKSSLLGPGGQTQDNTPAMSATRLWLTDRVATRVPVSMGPMPCWAGQTRSVQEDSLPARDSAEPQHGVPLRSPTSHFLASSFDGTPPPWKGQGST